MGIFDRLFGKRSPEVAAQREKRPSDLASRPVALPAENGDGAEDTTESAGAAREDQATVPEPAAKASPPLRTLTQYQHDPAFNNFKRRLTRAPGQEQRRSRNTDYPPSDETKR